MFEIGTNLREARQRRRIDLVEAEQDTKIRSKYLAAIENEEFDILPGPVFVRGFLRTYSRYLGLDPQHFIDEYNARFGRFEEIDDGPAFGRPGIGGERNNVRRKIMRVAIIISLIGLALILWAGLRSGEADSDVQLKPIEPALTSASPQPVDVDLANRQGLNDQQAITNQRGAAAPAKRTAKRSGAAPAAAGTRGRLRIAVTGNAWIEVRRGGRDGDVIFAGELSAGQSKVFRGPEFYVTSGVPSVTSVQYGDVVRKGSGAGTAQWLVSKQGIVLS